MNSDLLDRLSESLLKLTSATCRWPIGDPKALDFRFCLAQHAPGSPYCSEHHVVAFGKARGKAPARG